MTRWTYSKGLHDLGNGCHAWLQPDGTWGYSNAGLVVDGKDCLLVDTLFDLPLTREMLTGMRRAVPQAARIDTLVNTHSNGDHTFGNQLVEGAQIIAARGCAEEMAERPAETFQAMMANWRNMGEAGAFLHEVMGARFDFRNIVHTPPTQVFNGELSVRVGGKEVRLVEVGPAHTRGDVIVYVPHDRVVFTGDILFVGGHPVVWAGPLSNWIKACDLMLSWDVETVVPGHGPITDKKGVRDLKHYLEFILVEARKRYDAGMSDADAARDIAWDAFRDWTDPERVFVNVAAAYRDFRADGKPLDVMRLFTLMAQAHHARKAACGNAHAH